MVGLREIFPGAPAVFYCSRFRAAISTRTCGELFAAGTTNTLYQRADSALTAAPDAEAAAKAELRRACTAADPGCQVLNVRATERSTAPAKRLLAPDFIDV